MVRGNRRSVFALAGKAAAESGSSSINATLLLFASVSIRIRGSKFCSRPDSSLLSSSSSPLQKIVPTKDNARFVWSPAREFSIEEVLDESQPFLLNLLCEANSSLSERMSRLERQTISSGASFNRFEEQLFRQEGEIGRVVE
jgi:hypothetical protein